MATETPTMKLTKPASTDYVDVDAISGNFEKIDGLFPVGSVVMNTTGANPSTYIGGTWTRIENRFLVGAGATFPAGTTGGTSDKLRRSGTESAGYGLGYGDGGFQDRVIVSDESYTNEVLPPYMAVYIWRRTA